MPKFWLCNDIHDALRRFAVAAGRVALAAVLAVTLSVGVAKADSDIVLRLSHGLGQGGAENMDAHGTNAFYVMNQLVHERLTRTDETGAAAPYLATSWSIADDGLALTMELRKSVKFHDGSDFDAADVVYTINRVLDPEFDSPNRSTIKSVDSIEALGSHTV
ncbi:MAG: ABC transporter substrate-binding protein, partial [Alphaproteobacteria bacterium]|nr:ABC transporter substrate-binding protein [Alphaproteobacteria bacterium]